MYSEDLFMKKYAFMLLPLLVTSLIGCKGGTSKPNDAAAQFRKADKLKFNEDYAAKVEGLEYGSDTDIDHIYEKFEANAITIKATQIIYDEFENVERGDYSYSRQYDKYTLSNNHVFTLDNIYERTSFLGGRLVQIANNYFVEAFHNQSKELYIKHYIYDGNNHDVNLTNLHSQEQSYIDFVINEGINESREIALDHILDTYIYVIKNGYICYSQMVSNEYYDDITLTHKKQIIFEFDSNYRLLKGSYFEEATSLYDFFNDKAVSEPRTNYSDHRVFEITYGKKDDGSSVKNKVESLYSKPYFDDGNVYFSAGDEYDCVRRKTQQKIHLEGYSLFNSFSAEEIDVTPMVYFGISSGLYGALGSDAYPEDKYELKSNKLHYDEDGALMFKMDSANDALYIELDYEIKNNELVCTNGFVNVVSKDYINKRFGLN